MSDDQDGCEWVNVSQGTSLPGRLNGCVWWEFHPWQIVTEVHFVCFVVNKFFFSLCVCVQLSMQKTRFPVRERSLLGDVLE